MYFARYEIDKLNPWGAVPKQPPFVLRDDAKYIDAYDRDHANRSNNRVNTEIPPNPFVGSPFKPRVLVLTKTAPWDDDETAEFEDDEAYAERQRESLTVANRDSKYPFFYLDPEFAETQGYQWWRAKLNDLIEACNEKTGGQGQECVAQGLFTIAYFPYHVKSYNGKAMPLPSQQFSFGLVRLLRDEGVPIVIASFAPEWLAALPKLRGGATVKRASKQTSFLSRGNLPAGIFDTLVESLTKDFAGVPAEAEPAVQ